MALRALLSDSERSFRALITLPAGRVDGCGSIDICWRSISMHVASIVRVREYVFHADADDLGNATRYWPCYR